MKAGPVPTAAPSTAPARKPAPAPGSRLAPGLGVRPTPGAAHLRQVQRRAGNRAATALSGRAGGSTTGGRAPVVVQRLLGKNHPIVAADVANVLNPHGNVYILEGHHQDSVVVKFEVADPGEGLAAYRARFRAGEELGGAMLSGAVDKPELTAADLVGLRAIPANLGQSGALLGVLGNNIDQAAIGVKLDRIAMGETLFTLNYNNANGQNTPVLQQVLTARKALRYGEMAYFDVLTRNTDRILANGTVTANNIDFDATNTDAIPLDNIHYAGSLLNQNWGQQLAEMDAVKPARRQAFANAVVQSIIRASGQRFGLLAVQGAQRSVLQGINDAEDKAAAIFKRWNLARARRRGQAVDPDLAEARRVLNDRYVRGQA